MQIRMSNLERLTLAEMAEFVASNQGVDWQATEQQAVYGLIERVLKNQRYSRLRKSQRGVVRAFLLRVTGLRRAQPTRLIQRWMQERSIRCKPARRPSFKRRYTGADVELLAEVDAAHEDLSGPAVRRLLQRELKVFGNEKFSRLAAISVSHIYNLRKSSGYRKLRVRVEHTQARQVSIGERRKPDPYLNFHRPCGFATVRTSAKGKRTRVYRPDDYRTPYEKLTSLKDWHKQLKKGLSQEQLQRQR